MSRGLAILRKWGWLLLIGIAVALYFALRRPTGPVEDDESRRLLDILRDNLAKAEFDAEAAKAAVKVEAEGDRAELDDIRELPDGDERRQRLADLLTRLDGEGQ